MSPPIPQVTVTVVDNGASVAISVPQSNVQLGIGCAVGGTPNQPFATTNPQVLQSQFTGGPLVEAGGLVCQAGNVFVGISVPIVTKGAASDVNDDGAPTSTSVLTVTVDTTPGSWDRYFVKVRVLTGGTIGTTGIVLQVSLDAGRNYGSPISIGTATSLYLGQGALNVPAVGGTGVQLNFGAGDMVAGEYWQFSTTAPIWDTSGIAAGIAAYFASQFAVEGVGSVHIIGECAGSTDISVIQTALQTGTNGFVYQRAMVELRDAYAPVAWGGSGETESAWMTALATFVAGNAAQPRVSPDGGAYNMPSAFANQAGGLPSYRRPLTWARAVRRTQIGLQRRAGRVKDGPYSNINVNLTSDPADGFIYHDERITPCLNAARIGSALTWPKKGAGFFQCQEPLLSAPGSQFTELVIGNVLDVACDIGYATGVEEISDDLQAQANGTLDPVALNTFQGAIQTALDQGMIQTPLVSLVEAIISPTANVVATGEIPITITVTPKAYANKITETINLSNGA